MIRTPPDPFDEWFAVPFDLQCDDPRFVVARAAPDDFERVYDCVDAAFGRARPRALYDWIYRRNPYGRARVWNVEERSTGRVLKTGATFPWPIWHGDVERRGGLAGDAATVPDWQRRGLSEIRRTILRQHPWYGTTVTISEPNAASRIVSRKAGDADMLHGALRGGVAVLRAGPVIARSPVPGAVARPVGALVDPLFVAWRRLGARTGRMRVEPIDRFDTAFDEVTMATMSFGRYWSPHNAEFLNWRYLDHPIESYGAFALVDDDQPVGYSVIRFSGDEATLSELAVAPDRAGALLAGSLAVARAAGCAWVNFFALRGWRHWGAMRKAGFLPYTTDHHFLGTDLEDRDGSATPDAWQVTPGDRDYH